ncbi:VOC family protein [Microbacterium sp. ASV49]|uniref:VOC family protein n=1 Tax=Microbacterium candidum TaxID=3041922 RepID=A0ABT7MX48_9MICO|nr:VOC family protein [Microbacterium sp. ASV49]MDL9979018.1 VOC family protein [Microbacterium sp. ASV49]
MTTITPYLTVSDGPAALDFYRRAFGAEVIERYDDADGRLAHATLDVGGAILLVSGEYPELGAVSPTTLGGSTAAVVLAVVAPDATYAAAVDAGATADRPIEVDGSGARSGWIVDPFGHRWNIRGARRA